jgi:hypothetical protein
MTSIKSLLITTILPTPSVTIPNLATVTVQSTYTPLGNTQAVQKVVVSTLLATSTLPVQTVVLLETSREKEDTPSVTVTSTVVKTATVKSTSVV